MLATNPTLPSPTRIRRAFAFTAAAALAAGLGFLYAPVFARLAQQWWTDPNYSYGFFVPLFSAWLIWRRRSKLRALPLNPSNLGFLFVLGGLLMLVLGRLAAELLLTRVSFLVVTAGIVLGLAGWSWLRAIAFPLAFLGFMIPLPTLVFNLAAIPLQAVATRTGVGLVAWTGLPILRQGNVIVLPGTVLDVVAECSGIRSLLALLALGAAYGCLTEPEPWRRMALIAAMVPLAIVSNALRIAVTILLSFAVGSAASEGLWHLLTGLQVFVVAVLGLALLQRALRGSQPRQVRHA